MRRGDTVLITGRDKANTESVAAAIGPDVHGLAVDLAEPDTIEAAFAGVTTVDNLVITASDPTPNSIADFNTTQAVRSITVKLVGYAETVRVLRDRFAPAAAVVLFGGLAKERPYPGSTMVTTFNGGISGLTRTLAREIAPHRVNAIHPGIVGDSPYWTGKTAYLETVRQRTPTGQLTRMTDIVDATVFLLENPAVNGVNLPVDGGWLLM